MKTSKQVKQIYNTTTSINVKMIMHAFFSKTKLN